MTREFYYNDAGAQIDNLARSVQARARASSPTTALPDGRLSRRIHPRHRARLPGRRTVSAERVAPVTAHADPHDLDAIRAFAVAYLRHEQDLDLQAFGVRFDAYYLESSLYTDGKVAAAVEGLAKPGRTYELDGALWLRSTDVGDGDDKDRVMRKSDGGYTYFVPDVAYHVTKWERGFGKVINVQGSDHHGTIARVRAGLQAPAGARRPVPGYPDYVLHKMVRVTKGGEEVKISKRAGTYVTLHDLIEWVGPDATRFFLVSRKADTEFVFDVDLALSQSDENPVYYVQYAHARICSVFAQAADKGHAVPDEAAALKSDLDAARRARANRRLMSRLAEYPEVLAAAATELAPHQLAFYLKDLAADFHGYYNAERVLVDEVADARAPGWRCCSRRARCCATGSRCSAFPRRRRCSGPAGRERSSGRMEARVYESRNRRRRTRPK